ncbi:MAG: anti-sigma factor antagonist, partial [Chlamydiia bacterium]|nr:anti-sigma factor antagonist [Chlamydiia bacterium]
KIRFSKRPFLSPSEILGNLNKKISPQLGTLDYFVSLFYSRFDFDQSSLYFVDCGAAKPLHYSNKLKRVTELKGDHFPLGVNVEEHYHTQQVAFETGDCFVFYSDGVSEASAPNGDLFGVQRIADIVTNHAHNPAQKILELIQTATLRFSEKEALDDDMTIVVIKVIEQRTIPQKEVFSMQFSSHISQITAVRKFVETVCSEAPGDRERLTHVMQLVIDEIFSNIVNHGYGGDPTGIVEVIAGLDREGVTFQINDQGIHFNPESVAQPKLTGNQPNGFGWYLIRELVDHIAYVPKNSDEGKNQLTVSHRFIQGGSMEISHHADHDVLVVTLENEHLDSKDAAEFRERIQELCGKENLYQVIFDLHRLKFIDSSGLGAFLSILKMLKTNQGELKLASMGKSVQTMFELVCMHKIFDIFTTTDEALHAFRE